MLIPKKDRKEIYKFLFKEGVLWAPKDYSLEEHPNLPSVRNLYVIKAMQSFESKEYVTVRYAWRNLYWFLTDEGIEYLRGYLNIPTEVVPATLMKSTRPVERGMGREGRPPRGDGMGRGGGNWREGRDDYRGGGGGGFGRGGGGGGGGGGGDTGGAEKADAPAGYTPQFS